MCHVGRLYKKEVAARRLATVATSRLYQYTAQIACSQIGDIPQLLRSNLTADARRGGAASVEMEYPTMKFRDADADDTRLLSMKGVGRKHQS